MIIKAIKVIGIVFTGILVWAVVGIFLSYKAYDYVSFLAASVTDSCAFKLSFACGYFEWDKKLQIASYLSYLLVLIFITFSCCIALERSRSKYIKFFSVIVFIASFPAYTKWGVSSICGGFGPCSTGYYIDVVVPLIVTFHPWSLLSLGLAIATTRLYFAKREIVI